jgi:hypothetical protein
MSKPADPGKTMNKKNKKGNNINKIEEVELVLSCGGYLAAGPERGIVGCFAVRRGKAPLTVEIYGDTAVLETAWTAGSAIFSASGIDVRVEVTGISMETGALTVRPGPVLEAFAR